MCVWCVYCGKNGDLTVKLSPHKTKNNILLHMIHPHVHLIFKSKMNVCLDDTFKMILLPEFHNKHTFPFHLWSYRLKFAPQLISFEVVLQQQV